MSGSRQHSAVVLVCCHTKQSPASAELLLLVLLQVDLDLGNYERFLDITLTRDNNLTTGKVYQVWTRYNTSQYAASSHADHQLLACRLALNEQLFLELAVAV
jgi:hypothetical protein